MTNILIDNQCNICSEIINNKYNNNLEINYINIETQWSGLFTYKCSKCNSPNRYRIFKKYIETTYKENNGLTLYVISPSDNEMNIVKKFFNIKYITSLYDEKRKNCISGIDITKPIPVDDKFDICIAICVLDYLYNLEDVFNNINNILYTNGKFIFYIQSFRISNQHSFKPGSNRIIEYVDTVKINSNNALSYEKYAIKTNNITNINDCTFNVDYIKKCAVDNGFSFELIEIKDCISESNEKLFVLTKNN